MALLRWSNCNERTFRLITIPILSEVDIWRDHLLDEDEAVKAAESILEFFSIFVNVFDNNPKI